MRMISKMLDCALSDVLFFQTRIRSLPCLVTHLISPLVEFCSNRCICQSSEMGFFKLSHVYMDLSKLIHGIVKVATWICKSCYMVDLFISHPLPNKTKLKFGQDFKACWSFCFESCRMSQSTHSMPGIRCAFGNVFINKFSKYFTSERSKGLSGSKMWHRKHSIIIALRISHFFAALKSLFQN